LFPIQSFFKRQEIASCYQEEPFLARRKGSFHYEETPSSNGRRRFLSSKVIVTGSYEERVEAFNL